MKIFEEIVKGLKKAGTKEIINKSTKFSSMGIDSLDLMDLVVHLEEKLSIHIPDDKLLTLETVGDLLTVIEELKKYNEKVK